MESKMKDSRGRWRVGKRDLAPCLNMQDADMRQRSLVSSFWCGLFNLVAAQ